MIKKQRKNKAFTLVELLIAMMVTAIVLTAAATMAGALSSGKTVGDQAGRNGAYLMQLQSRLSDLTMRANAVVFAEAQEVVLWHDHNVDGAGIDSEYTTIGVGDAGQLVMYNNLTPDVKESYPKCGNVQFWADHADVAQIKNLTIQWDMVENGITQSYRVCGTLRGKN